MEPLTPDLLGSAASSILSPSSAPTSTPPSGSPAGGDFREFGDTDATRSRIYENVLSAAQSLEPVSNARHTLRLTEVDYQDPDKISRREQKAAILEGRTRGRRLRGTWELVDNETGNVIDQKRSVLATVPHMTERGTFINNGSEYTLKNQQRLRPGVYTRLRDNGEVESHANIMPGKGLSHRYFLDPDKGTFRMRVGQGTVGLMPLLRAMGVDKEKMKESWGPDLFATAYNADDDAGEYKKLKQKFLTKKELEGDENDQRQALIDKFHRMELDPEVTKRTLGYPHESMTPEAVMDITKKLAQVSRQEAGPDDRDSLTFQNFMGPEDLFAERIARDKGNLRRQLLWKMSGKGNLQSMPSSALNKQLQAALMSSGLGQSIEEINPAELYDKSTSVSRLGEGGIPSTDAIPKEARSVQPSMFGFIDPVRTPECYDRETEVMVRRGWVKWPDIKDSDEFACLIDGRLEYHKASRLICQPYRGLMYGADTGRVAYLVTPNHRLWVRPLDKGTQYRIVTAEECHERPRRVCSGGFAEYLGEGTELFELPDVEVRSNNVSVVSSVPIGPWAELMGWWLGEGNSWYRADTSAFGIKVTQSRSANPANCSRVEKTLAELPFAWSYSDRSFTIATKQIGAYFQQFCKSPQRFIPDYLLRAPKHARQRLYDALLLGEGRKNRKGERTQFCTTSYQLACDFERLAFSLGRASRVVFEPDGREQSTTGGAWVVHIHKHNEHQIRNRKVQATQCYTLDFDDEVFCATVPGGLLYVRRGDTVGHWSGNSGKVGVDTYLARGARKGRDGKLYSQFRNVKTGELEFRTPQEVADMTVAFPQSMENPGKRVAAMQGGKMTYVPKEQVDLVLPSFEDAFNPLSNVIPMKSQVKGQRLVMASRMTTQALPIRGAEAPLVQSAVPGTEGRQSYEELYSKPMGSLKAPQGGVVERVDEDGIHVRYEDGTRETHELYENFPFNRKTFIHQTPTVEPGQRFQADQLLARSNFTDSSGAMALGRNARTAYIPWQGKNFEDANVISESFAKKMASEHMYQHDLEVDDQTVTGKQDYVKLFPGKFSKQTLGNLDERGVIKPGTEVKYGDPLILGARQKENAHNRVHKKGQSSHVDATVIWNHHDPGTVTDVVMGKKGPTVVVKAFSPMQIGDKLSGRYGDKGVIADVIPDSQMPHDDQGQPFEVLLNPLGVITRCYDEHTEFLTKSGWKFGRQIVPEDHFVCFHPWTESLHVLPQLMPFHVADYRGRMLKFANKLLDFCVTPEHRMWAACGYPGAPWQEVTADRIFQRKGWKVPVAGHPVGGEDVDFQLPQLSNKSIKDTQSNTEEIVIDAGDWAEFLGWYVAEGNSDDKVHISQSLQANPESCDALAQLLDRLPFAWHYNKSNTQFHITSKRLCVYLKQFGLCDEKFIPDWVFQQSEETRQRFLDAYLAGDGSKDLSRRQRDYHGAGTMSGRLADDLQRLFVYQGISSNTSKHASGMHNASIHLKRHRLLDRDGWSEFEYQGKIYCPTVPTGYVVTRRNGKLLIAGNTNPAQLAELLLGKIAAKQGKPVKVQDFDSKKDMSEWVIQELAKEGMSDLDDILDPSKDQKIKDIATGSRFFMKLHHTAESKGQSRGGGSYTMDGSPAKGGADGCFTANQKIITHLGPMSIAAICEQRLGIQVRTYSETLNEWVYRPVTDWFTYRARVADLLTIHTVGGPCEKESQHTRTHSHLRATRNHIVLTYDGRRIEVGDLTDKDQLVTWGPVPTDHQMEFLLGTMLGDASANGTAVRFEHSLKQTEFISWKKSILAGLNPKQCDCVHDHSQNPDFKTKRIKSRAVWITEDPVCHKIANLCYDPDQVKRVTPEWLDQASDLSIAVWLLDDGSITNRAKKKGRIAYSGNIATHRFDRQSAELLCDWLNARLGSKCIVNTVGAINLTADACRGLVEIVAAWVPVDAIPRSKKFLRRQVGEIQKTHPPFAIKNVCQLGKVPLRVSRIEAYRHDKPGVSEINVYDFTVDDTHTYVAGHALVSNSKRIGMLDTNALLSHGATATLQDVSSVRGQKNEDYWMQFMSGYNPTVQKVPHSYKKFVNQLQASGVNVIKDGPQTHVMAMTDKDVDKLAGSRKLTSAEGVDWGRSLKEIPGGLFDKSLTGGHGGNRWSYIPLTEPLPNPVVEEPLRRILGLTKKQFAGVLSGKESLGNHGTGPTGMRKALEAIDLDQELEKTRQQIKSGRKSDRDAAVRKLGYLKSLKQNDLQPADYMMSKVPVLPPNFRPVSLMSNDMPLVDDSNYLYKELFEANENLREARRELGEDAVGDERLGVYNAFKAVTGLGDPINPKTKEKGVKGILQSVFGSSPKFGTLQRKLISTTVDNVGRAVITPNPDLDMDSVGLPEEKAFDAYQKFVTRRLVRQGMSLRAAREAIQKKTPLARRMLVEEMQHRPVYISRAPVLHKFGIMAMRPRLTKGETLQVSPLIVKGFNADFDGDAMNYHVPSTEGSRQEALERLLPSRNLFSLSDFKSPMHLPANEYVGGLYEATSAKSERPKRIFRTITDMKKAYQRGDLSIDDPVQILES